MTNGLPTSWAIVARLAGDATVNELAAPFAMTLPGISKHLKILERCGLISRTRHAQFRPCHLERAALDAAVEVVPDEIVGDYLETVRRGELRAAAHAGGTNDEDFIEQLAAATAPRPRAPSAQRCDRSSSPRYWTPGE